MKKLKVKKEFKWSRKLTNPYTIVFIYPVNSDPFIVKGGLKDCEKWVEKNVDYPAFINKTLWFKKQFRNMWSFKNCGRVYLSTFTQDNILKYGRPFVIYHNFEVIDTLRNIPKAFPKAVKKLLTYDNS